MGKRQFQLDEAATKQFREGEGQTGSVAELKRLQAVRLYGGGVGIAQIREVTGCAESSIREWVQDDKRDGLAGLGAHYERSAQNASKLSAAGRNTGTVASISPGSGVIAHATD